MLTILSAFTNSMKVIALSLLLLGSALNVSANVVCGPKDTLIPNPEDCNSFYNCGNGIPILTQCPPTLHFNPEALYCDRPENVNCQVTSSSTADPTTTSTTAKITTTTSEEPTTTSTTEKTTTSQQTTTTEEPTTTSTTEETTTSQQTTTTEEPSNPIGCPPKGSEMITNPNDCSSFLVCIDGLNTTVPCPNGMYWNEKIKTCDSAENVECGDRTTEKPTSTSTTEKETTTETTTSTTEKPTSTSTTESTTTTTEKPTSTSTTESPTTTTEKPTSTSTTESATTTTENPTSTSTTEKQTSTESTTSTSEATTEQPGYEPDCPEEGFETFENPESCSSFYVCVNGIYGLVHCVADHDFNPVTERCDLPADPQCKAGTTPPPPPYVPPCPENETIQLPDPASCESFYICINGNYAKLPCPTDYEFNVTSQSCVLPKEPTCNHVKTYELAFECEEDGTFPNPEDCTKYYVCLGDQIITMECPGGLHFDVSLSGCNTPEAAQCEISSTSEPSSTETTEESSTTEISTTTTEASTEPSTSTSTEGTTTDRPGSEPNCPENGTVVLPKPDNCTQFFICIEGLFDVVDCPKGYAFNEELGRCDLAENVEGCNAVTPPPNHPECPTNGSAKLPNPEDCGSYFFCLNGQSALIDCPDDLNFDTDKEMCTPDAICETETTTTEKVTSTSTSSASSTSSTTTEEATEGSTSTDESSTSSDPTSSPGTCSDEGGLYPNPDDCSTFFQCANEILVLQNCPEGLEYNADKQYCDDPALANCSETKNSKSLFSFLKFWNNF